MKSLLANLIIVPKITTQFEGDVVLTETCVEKGVSVERVVRKMYFSFPNLQKFWEKSRQFPTLFNEEINDDFHKFLEVFLVRNGDTITTNGLFWVIDDFIGVYYITHIIPDVSAQVHYSFFDRRQNGREELTKKMISHVFNKFGFNRLSVHIPCYAHDTTFNFVERLGFKYEGRLREAIKFKGDWFDVKLFGLTRRMHFNGHTD